MQKELVIAGAGESGTGAAILAHQKGYAVFVTDGGSIKPCYREELTALGIPFEEGSHSMQRILNASEVIKSPGIAESTELMHSIRSKGIPVISEIEFAARHTRAHLTGITGSNGKTTTTLLTGYIMKKAGIKVGVGGNVGKSFARLVAEAEYDHFVLELSSFQLDDVRDLHLNTSVLLNITPDHLDRYEYKMENYVNSKFRIANNQTNEDAFIYCMDDAEINKALPDRKIAARTYGFSLTQKPGAVAWLSEDELIINLNHNRFAMYIHDLALKGKHNAYNSMASGIAARLLDIRKDGIRECLSDFQNVEHRLEFVARIHGIEFINDSKATNVNSTWYALESMTKPTVLILGGVDKGNDYALLNDLVKQKVTAIICLGKDNKKIHKAFEGVVDKILDATTAEEAVALGYRHAREEQVVLLSPACASFDLFENYEERGRKFKEAVRAL